MLAQGLRVSSGSLAMLAAMRPRPLGSRVRPREFAPTARQSRRMARRLLEGHGVRRGALGVLSGHNEHPDPVMSGDAGLGRVMA